MTDVHRMAKGYLCHMCTKVSLLPSHPQTDRLLTTMLDLRPPGCGRIPLAAATPAQRSGKEVPLQLRGFFQDHSSAQQICALRSHRLDHRRWSPECLVENCNFTNDCDYAMTLHRIHEHADVKDDLWIDAAKQAKPKSDKKRPHETADLTQDEADNTAKRAKVIDLTQDEGDKLTTTAPQPEVTATLPASIPKNDASTEPSSQSLDLATEMFEDRDDFERHSDTMELFRELAGQHLYDNESWYTRVLDAADKFFFRELKDRVVPPVDDRILFPLEDCPRRFLKKVTAAEKLKEAKLAKQKANDDKRDDLLALQEAELKNARNAVAKQTGKKPNGSEGCWSELKRFKHNQGVQKSRAADQMRRDAGPPPATRLETAKEKETRRLRCNAKQRLWRAINKPNQPAKIKGKKASSAASSSKQPAAATATDLTAVEATSPPREEEVSPQVGQLPSPPPSDNDSGELILDREQDGEASASSSEPELTRPRSASPVDSVVDESDLNLPPPAAAAMDEESNLNLPPPRRCHRGDRRLRAPTPRRTPRRG